MDSLELMRTFMHIVDAGGISAAAAQMDSTQPTVSRRLGMLERELGVRLLRRTTHSLAMTLDGERCHARGKELLLEWERFLEEMRGAASEPEGLLRVVVPHAFGQEKLVDPLALFLRRHPEVKVEWMLRDQLPDFAASGIDCAIHLGPVQDQSLVAIKLVDVARILVAAPSLLGSRRPIRRPQDLEALPWLSLSRYYTNTLELSHQHSGRTCRIAFDSRMGTDNIYALRHAAIAGLGVCAASAWLLRDSVACAELVHILPRWRASPLPIHLVYPYARHYPARLRRFVELMKEHVPVALNDDF